MKLRQCTTRQLPIPVSSQICIFKEKSVRSIIIIRHRSQTVARFIRYPNEKEIAGECFLGKSMGYEDALKFLIQRTFNVQSVTYEWVIISPLDLLD